MEKELPIRKHPRLKGYDYSSNGYYHVTICTENNMPILFRSNRRAGACSRRRIYRINTDGKNGRRMGFIINKIGDKTANRKNNKNK